MFAPLTHVPALQKLLCPLYPSQRLCCAAPSSLQSLPLPDSQSRMCLAVLKLPLGNLIPDTKPETQGIPNHASRGPHLQIRANMHNSAYFECWGSPGFYSPHSPLCQLDRLWLSDRRFAPWEPIAAWCVDKESGSHSFSIPSCSINIHTYHPFHLHLGDYTLQLSYLPQHTSFWHGLIPLFTF